LRPKTTLRIIEQEVKPRVTKLFPEETRRNAPLDSTFGDIITVAFPFGKGKTAFIQVFPEGNRQVEYTPEYNTSPIDLKVRYQKVYFTAFV
jgi:hypothetical protein